MNEWMPHFARPAWLLLLIPLAWLFWQLWKQRRRVGQWPLLLPAAFQPWLLVEGMPPRRRPWLLLAMAWMLAVLALSGPGWQRMGTLSHTQGEALVVLLDMSPDLYAADIPPSRLAQVRRMLHDLVTARTGLPTGLVAYAGSAHVVVPLADDPATTFNLLDSLTPELMPLAGQRADLAVEEAIKLLKQGAAGQGRLLLLTSHLDEREQSGIRAILDENPLIMDVLGVGTETGAPVPNEQGGFERDANGAIRLARVQTSTLMAAASDANGHYALLDEHYEIPPVLLSHTEQGERLLPLREDQGHWFLLPLALLAAFGARRGWLLALALFIAPPPSQAFEFQDLWLRADQQGFHLLQEQQPLEAAQRFQDTHWKGVALYQAGDYAAAARLFASDDSAAGHYNRGNALAMNGELDAALSAYNQALRHDPQFAAASLNRQRVEERLRQQFREQQAQNDAPKHKAAQTTADATSATTLPLNSQGGNGTPTDAPDDAPATSSENSASHNTPTDATEDDSSALTIPPPNAAEFDPRALERQQALEQWLRQIPDEPAELLRQKFRHELQQQEKPF